MSQLPRVILCIPGHWADRSDITTSIVKLSGGYLFAGVVMIHIETKAAFTLEVTGHDLRLRDAFEIAGRGTLSEPVLESIDRHTHVLYLIGHGGSFENARGMMRAAQALIRSGGLAVKVESSGLAHTAERWAELTEEPLPIAIHDAFVTYVGEPGEYYSCGMHNLGFPDAVVNAHVPPREAAELLHTFLLYVAFEKPTLNEGETFGVAANAPRYRLSRGDQVTDSPDDPFHNPFGVWQLTPV